MVLNKRKREPSIYQLINLFRFISLGYMTCTLFHEEEKSKSIDVQKINLENILSKRTNQGNRLAYFHSYICQVVILFLVELCESA